MKRLQWQEQRTILQIQKLKSKEKVTRSKPIEALTWTSLIIAAILAVYTDARTQTDTHKYSTTYLTCSYSASIPGRTSSEDGPGIDCLRMR